MARKKQKITSKNAHDTKPKHQLRRTFKPATPSLCKALKRKLQGKGGLTNFELEVNFAVEGKL